MKLENGVWKYVFVSGEYRFVHSLDFGKNHASLVKKGETAISAGTINVKGNLFQFVSHGSMTLNVDSRDEDTTELEKILGIPRNDMGC